MTGNSCILDTSIVIQALRNNQTTGRQLDALEKIYVPLIAVGELFFGAYKSVNLEKHLFEIEKLLAKCTILFPDFNTADVYGRTKASLVKKGRPIPENDIWIAAIALQHDLELYTTDAHFREVDGLRLFNPLTSV
jgi:tRNA(fMet)-specific endonuclease VapC